MKRVLLLSLIIFTITGAYALDIVYPKNKNININSPSTFFIGSADVNKPLTINNKPVNIHPSGGFAQSVQLNNGENTFHIKSGDSVLTYKITRKYYKPSVSNETKLILYENKKYGYINSNNSPLRSTPIDFGINRISHLPEGTNLTIDGEQNNFYRVCLGEDKKGWISKNNVDFTESIFNNAELQGINYLDTDKYYIYNFKLTKKVPWSIEEKDGLNINIYNIDQLKNNTFSIHFQKDIMMHKKNLIGYFAEYQENNLVIKIKKPLKICTKQPLKNITITIDPGHGGKESGAIGCLGHLEKDLNLLYAKELESELKSRGATVIMTREKDEYVDLYKRVEIANNNDSEIFISLHGNALPDNKDPLKNYGTEIYYFYDQAKPLAISIMNEIEKIPSAHNHGIIPYSFAVVRNTNALSILIEVGYLINPEDNSLIITDDYRKKTARAIADGLEQYILSQK